MNITPPGLMLSADGKYASRGWAQWVAKVSAILTGMAESGVTADRPTKGLWTGRPYFDTTLGYPIWYDGSGWVDATGAGV